MSPNNQNPENTFQTREKTKERPRFIEQLQGPNIVWIFTFLVLIITVILVLVLVLISEADKEDAKKILRYDDGCPVNSEDYSGLEDLKCRYRIQPTTLNDSDSPYIDTSMETNEMMFENTFRNLNESYPLAKYYYVGVYESSTNGQIVNLEITDEGSTDIILILSSYYDVKWNITGDKNDQIKAVVFDSYYNDSTVFNSDNLEVIKLSGLYNTINSYEFDENFQQSAGFLMSEYNVELEGFSGKFSADKLTVPQFEFNSSNIDTILKQTKKYQTTTEKPLDMDNCIKTSSGDTICGGEGEDLIIT